MVNYRANPKPPAHPLLMDPGFLRQSYLEDRRSITAIGSELGVTGTTVSRYLHRHRIPVRHSVIPTVLQGVGKFTLLKRAAEVDSLQALAHSFRVTRPTLEVYYEAHLGLTRAQVRQALEDGRAARRASGDTPTVPAGQRPARAPRVPRAPGLSRGQRESLEVARRTRACDLYMRGWTNAEIEPLVERDKSWVSKVVSDAEVNTPGRRNRARPEHTPREALSTVADLIAQLSMYHPNARVGLDLIGMDLIITGVTSSASDVRLTLEEH